MYWRGAAGNDRGDRLGQGPSPRSVLPPPTSLARVTATETQPAKERWRAQWAELFSEVVTSGLCTGCAGCVVACPHDVLGYDDQNGVYKPFHLEEELVRITPPPVLTALSQGCGHRPSSRHTWEGITSPYLW